MRNGLKEERSPFKYYKRILRISIRTPPQYSLAEIKEENEVEESRELSKSLLDEPRTTSVQRALSEYNRPTLENAAGRGNVQPENVDVSDDEGAQTPLQSDIRAQEVSEGKENIVPTPQAKLAKPINFSAVPPKPGDQEKALAKKAISGAIGQPGNKAELLRDFKEGWLQKQSRSLLTPWKAKYCRLANLQFCFYRNVATGWLSGLVDFKRVAAKITVDSPALCFKYFLPHA